MEDASSEMNERKVRLYRRKGRAASSSGQMDRNESLEGLRSARLNVSGSSG